MLRFAFAALALPAVAIAAAPAAAQMFSAGYEFLEAVRDRDGAKAMERLNGANGAIVVNTRDRSTGQTALHIVVARRDMTWLNFLMQRGANANIGDRDGQTPLLLAAQIGFVDGAQALVARGAQVNLANGRGETALHIAVQRRDVPLVRALLAAGADPDITDNIAGKSPRDYARDDSRGAAVLALLDAPRPTPAATPQVSGPN